MGKQVGTENILGKECEIYEVSGMKIWMWNGISLKSQMSMMGNYTMEAVSLDVDKSIPASKFQPPANTKIVEQDMEMPFGFK